MQRHFSIAWRRTSCVHVWSCHLHRATERLSAMRSFEEHHEGAANRRFRPNANQYFISNAQMLLKPWERHRSVSRYYIAGISIWFSALPCTLNSPSKYRHTHPANPIFGWSFFCTTTSGLMTLLETQRAPTNFFLCGKYRKTLTFARLRMRAGAGTFGSVERQAKSLKIKYEK